MKKKQEKSLTELLNIRQHLCFLASSSSVSLDDLVVDVTKYFKQNDKRLGHRLDKYFVIGAIIAERKKMLSRF